MPKSFLSQNQIEIGCKNASALGRSRALVRAVGTLGTWTVTQLCSPQSVLLLARRLVLLVILVLIVRSHVLLDYAYDKQVLRARGCIDHS